MEELTKEEIQYISGLLHFAKIDDRLSFTPRGDEVLTKLNRMVLERMTPEERKGE